MIEDTWPRIAGAHMGVKGAVSGVWMARDPANDVVHVYDAFSTDREVLAVIAEAFKTRGTSIPIAWRSTPLSESLRERQCYTLRDPVDESMIEMVIRDIWERMRTGRFKVDQRLKRWVEEYRTFNRDDDKLPEDDHPLMLATIYGMSELDSAVAPAARRVKRPARKTALV